MKDNTDIKFDIEGFTDNSGNIIGRMSTPTVLYPANDESNNLGFSPYQGGALLHPKLNDSGSLYYWAYPNLIDIVDVQNGFSRLRCALAETVSNVPAPMAIDSGGRHIYLITNKGLTVVDLGQAPLSIGHLSQTSAAPGTAVVIRGSGFEDGLTVKVGGVTATTTSTDENTLTFVVPTVASGPQDLVLQNPDGAAYTMESGIQVQ